MKSKEGKQPYRISGWTPDGKAIIGTQFMDKMLTPEKPLEVERKFVIYDLPLDYKNYPAAEITQGYTGDGLRYRISRDRETGRATYTISRKSGKGVARTEDEKVVSKEIFDKGWSDTLGRRINKTRYFIPYDEREPGIEIHLDIYDGPFRGLVTAEAEFDPLAFGGNDKAIARAAHFVPPTWFYDRLGRLHDRSGVNKETGINEYSNKQLSLKRELPEEFLMYSEYLKKYPVEA